MQPSSLLLSCYSSDRRKRSASPRGSKCLQLATARGPLPSLYDFTQPQLYSLRQTNLKLSTYPPGIHLILLDSLISNATSNVVQRHFTAVKNKSYFITLSNNYTVCLPVCSHERAIGKNSAARGSSSGHREEQTRRRALERRRARLDSVCKADTHRDTWRTSKHSRLPTSRLRSSCLLLAIKSCAQI